MNLHLEMYDLETSEKLAQSNVTYALNFSDSKDRGFKYLLSWLYSCVRGIRVKKLTAIELRIQFFAPLENQHEVFEGFDREVFNEKAGAFLI